MGSPKVGHGTSLHLQKADTYQSDQLSSSKVRSAHPSDVAIRAFLFGRLQLQVLNRTRDGEGQRAMGHVSERVDVVKWGTDSHRDGWMWGPVLSQGEKSI